MNNEFTIAGTNIPYANQYADKVASNRIHQAKEGVQKNILAYDRQDIAGVLKTLIDDSKGVLANINADGTAFTVKGQLIDKKSVKWQLGALAVDLQKVVDVVTKTFETTEGKERWGEQDLLNVHDEITISKSTTPKQLLDLAAQMEKRASEI